MATKFKKNAENRKLSADQVQEIIDTYNAGGITMEDLGAHYGVTGTTVKKVVDGKYYDVSEKEKVDADAWEKAGPYFREDLYAAAHLI